MGTIKFEIDLPEFEKELNISVTIRRDGEVVYHTSSPSTGGDAQNVEKSNRELETVSKLGDEGAKPKRKSTKSAITTKPTNPELPNEIKKPKSNGGNFMGMDF